MTPPSLGRKSLGVFATKERADAAFQEALVNHRRGIEFDVSRTTVADLVARFLKTNEKRLSSMTYHRYEQLWKHHAQPTIGKITLADVRAANVDELYRQLSDKLSRRQKPLSKRSIHHVHRLLFNVFAWGERKNMVRNNPMRKIDPPPLEDSHVRELTPDEAAAFLEGARGHRLYPFFKLAAATGARRGELAALMHDAIDLDHLTITIRSAIGSRFDKDPDGNVRRKFFVKDTKSGRPRTVPLNPSAIAALRMARARQVQDKLASHGLYEDRGFVFTDELGQHINPDGASHAFTDIANKIGLRGVSLHSVRHSVATWGIASGLDVITVAALLGHTTPAITLRTYGHVQIGSQERAVSVIGEVLDRAEACRTTSRS